MLYYTIGSKLLLPRIATDKSFCLIDGLGIGSIMTDARLYQKTIKGDVCVRGIPQAFNTTPQSSGL